MPHTKVYTSDSPQVVPHTRCQQRPSRQRGQLSVTPQQRHRLGHAVGDIFVLARDGIRDARVARGDRGACHHRHPRTCSHGHLQGDTWQWRACAGRRGGGRNTPCAAVVLVHGC
eukprot:360194-Chlamydomonas_euryale.AAC.19